MIWDSTGETRCNQEHRPPVMNMPPEQRMFTFRLSGRRAVSRLRDEYSRCRLGQRLSDKAFGRVGTVCFATNQGER